VSIRRSENEGTELTSTITAYNNFKLNMLAPHEMGGGTPIGQPTLTSTQVTFITTTGRFDVYGTNFSINPVTKDLTGTANRVTYSEGGIVMAEADGLGLTSAQVLKISQSSSMVEALIDAILAQDTVFRMENLNDFMEVGTGRDVVYGGGGVDTVIIDHSWGSKTKAQYEIKKQADGSFTVSNKIDHVTLHDVERVQFSDGVVALDTAGIAGQAYRLYQAAFDRTPDSGGLKYWIDKMDSGQGLFGVAANFIGSSEFQSAYGSLSNLGLVDQLYKNILGRAAEKGGLDFGVGQLDSGAMDRATVLANISESAENVALVAPAIDGGIWLI